MQFLYRELHIPSMLIAVILGYQLAGYFIYKYIKNKRKKLGLNKILLAFGLFFALLHTSFLVRIINNYYASDPLLYDITRILIIIFFLSSVMAFLAFVGTPSFKEILNPLYAWILIFLNLIPIIGIFFISYDSFLFQLFLIPNALSLFYIVWFELKLMQNTKGEVKRRLWFILAGEFLLGISLFLGGEESAIILYESWASIVWMVAIYIAIAGLMIIFLGVYRFPAFLEFGWRNNLISVFIIDRQHTRELYSYDFTKQSSNQETKKSGLNSRKRKVMPKGILGINDIIGYYTDAKEKDIEKIRHGDWVIRITPSSPGLPSLLYALVATEDMRSWRYLLETIRVQFEELYGEILHSLPTFQTEDLKLFESFESVMEDLLH